MDVFSVIQDPVLLPSFDFVFFKVFEKACLLVLLWPGSDICYFCSHPIGENQSHGTSWIHGGRGNAAMFVHVSYFQKNSVLCKETMPPWWPASYLLQGKKEIASISDALCLGDTWKNLEFFYSEKGRHKTVLIWLRLWKIRAFLISTEVSKFSVVLFYRIYQPRNLKMNHKSCHQLHLRTSINYVFGPRGIYCSVIYKIALVTSGHDKEQSTSTPFKRTITGIIMSWDSNYNHPRTEDQESDHSSLLL